MTVPPLSYVLVDKLSHHLEEIRIRALDNIISKVNLGFINEDDFALRKKLLIKLLDWFSFNSCEQRNKVLDLLHLFLKGKLGKQLILEVGASKILSTLATIKGQGDASILTSIKQIENLVSTDVADLRSSFESIDLQCSNDLAFDGSQLSQKEENKLPQEKCELVSHRDYLEHQNVFWNSLQFMQLPWQPLVATDRHVLAAIEESLSSMNDPDLVLHTCNFFIDVMLQDFPAEVFLQRPAIVKIFITHLSEILPGSHKRVCSAILKCLHKLTSALLIRINFYSDPSMTNSKQEGCITRSQTPSYGTQGSSDAVDVGFSTEHIGPRNFDYHSEDEYLRAGGDNNLSMNMRSHFQDIRDQSRLGEKGYENNDVEDTVFLQFQQMHLPLFCMLTLHQAISHRSIHLTLELIKLADICGTSNIWTSENSSVREISSKATRVLQLLGDAIKLHMRAPQTDEDTRLTYLQTIALTRKFLVSVVPLKLADALIPGNLKEALLSSLLDYSLMCILPDLHRDIRSYCEMFTGTKRMEKLQHFNDVVSIALSMTSTVNFLKNYERMEGKKILSLAEHALPSLAFHKASLFVKIVFEVCVNKQNRWSFDEEDQRVITKIVLGLLTHCDPDIKLEMYTFCHQHITSTLGVEHTAVKYGPCQVSFLLHVNILTEIICYGVTNDDHKISQFSSEILIHLLKAKIFMTSSLWQEFIEQLIPTMPLLECHAKKSSDLGRTIVGMLDPKNSDSLCISKIEIMKGNLRLLFATDEYVRNDAVSRLMALVVHEDDSTEKLPKITSVHFRTLVTYYLFEDPLDITVPRCHSSFYEINSMCQVLEVLKGDVTEPRIYRSALNQMAAMMEDPLLHSSFLEQNGIDLCLYIFKRALIEKDFEYYPDSVISVISILKNLCFQSSKVRLSLSKKYSLYCCILRALFMFGNNPHVRQDIGQLFCLLLYAEQLLSIPMGNLNSSVWQPLSLPEIIVKYMKLPFRPRIHWHTSPHMQPSLKGALLSSDASHSFLRLCWTCEWFGGVKQMLSWHTMKLTEQFEFSEFSSVLRASVNDLSCLKCTALNHCAKQCLYNIQNGTCHQSVETSVKQMLGYVTLLELLKEGNDIETQGNWKSMPWDTTLIRFFATAPACADDEDLLICLLQFLSVCIQHLSPTDIAKSQWSWVCRILKDPSQPLPGMLRMDSSCISKNVCREVLQLCQDCCYLEQQLEEGEIGKSKISTSWVHLIFVISQNLKFHDTQHFYNLAFLDWMLTCLSRVSGSVGWSRGCESPGQLTKDLIWHLAEIIIAFHCNKAGQNGTSLASFMGTSVARNAVICMNHVLFEMQNTSMSRNWEAEWFAALMGSNPEEEVNLSWLPSLWISRDPVVRCSALQLVSGLVSSQLGSRFLIQGLRECPPDIWDVAISFLLDQDEACMVREQAAIILTNLTNHSMPPHAAASTCISTDSNINSAGESVEVLADDAFVSLLEEKHFFSRVVAMFSVLYLEPYVKVGSWPSNNGWSADSASAVSQDTDIQHVTASQEDEANINLTTPNLIKAVCWFLNNILTLAPEEVVENVKKFGLVKIIFQSISEVPVNVGTKIELLHYVELLEMYISICTLLAKCVCVDLDCLSVALSLNDCLKSVIVLLDPDLYCVHRGDLVLLRSRLWSRIYRLLSCFLSEAVGYESILNAIIRSKPAAFMLCLENSINSKTSSELSNSALSCLTLLLSLEIKTQPIQYMSCGTSENQRNSISEIKSFQNILDWNFDKHSNSDCISSGEKLCALLIHQYEIHTLKHCSGDNKNKAYFPKSVLIGALSSLLSVSHKAKILALKEGLLESIMVQLKELHIIISVEVVDSRALKSMDKKRGSPVFQEVSLLFGLLTNFLYKAPEVKTASVSGGLADTIHKMWAWCCVIPSLLIDTLKLLCTYTTESIPACQSLVLTTPIVGVTSRKAPTSNSLIHEIISLTTHEMELLTKQGDLGVLGLAFHLLRNSSHSQECRVILFKSTLFHSLIKLYPAFTKKTKHWDILESMWLPLFLDCTAHPEGQIGFPKVPEALEIISSLADHSKENIRHFALSILRNITFHHQNRPRLLSSASYLQLLNEKLYGRNEDEINMVIHMVWALVANNQKAKLIMKNSGIASKIQEISNRVKVVDEESESKIHRQMLDYVLRIIYTETTTE